MALLGMPRYTNKKIISDPLYEKVSSLVFRARESVVRTVNTTILLTYFQIGMLIVEEQQDGERRAKYASGTLEKLSLSLSKKFGKGFSVDNLERMRKFYLLYSNSDTMSRKSDKAYLSNLLNDRVLKLSWSHIVFLISVNDFEERSFYEIETVRNNWSVRELKRQHNSSLYERVALSRDKERVMELSKQGLIASKAEDILKEPYILEFLGIKEGDNYSEYDLETSLINNLQNFLLELGDNFSFVSRQKKITLGEEHFYIDLVFYHRILKCFVLLDLKIGKLKHQDIGQMQMYTNIYDRTIKSPEESKTIGIILCKDKEEAIIKYTLPEDNDQIFARKYKLYLPSKKDLKIQLNL